MALRDFRLPDVGEGLTEAEILQWYVAVGDVVTINQMICEIETAKAAVELPSPYAGTVTALKVNQGETVDVGTVIITIEDTAPGLSLENLTRIFEPLYRADPARGREASGSGLGLAICQQIVKAHHGAIRAEVSPRGGVIFLIVLPLVADTAL